MDKATIEFLAMQVEGIASAFLLISGSDIIEDYEHKMFYFFSNQLADISKQLIRCCYTDAPVKKI